MSKHVIFHAAFAGMAESLPILGPRSLVLETETLTVPNSNALAQAWALHHWVYDLNYGDTEAQSEDVGFRGHNTDFSTCAPALCAIGWCSGGGGKAEISFGLRVVGFEL